MNLLINSNLSRFQAFALLVLALLCLPGSRGIGDEATAGQRYTGVMTLPIDLFTPEGTKIEKGRCRDRGLCFRWNSLDTLVSSRRQGPRRHERQCRRR